MLHPKTSPAMIAAAAAGLLIIQSSESQAAISYSVPGSAYTQNFDILPNTPENASLTATKQWADDMTPSATVTSIPGFFLYHPLIPTSEAGTNGHQGFRIGAGTATTGRFYSWGSSGSADRALGSLNADTISTPQNAATPPATVEDSQIYIGLQLTNNTGVTLTSFSLAFTGEQWRLAGNGPTGFPGTQVTSDGFDFQYSLDPTATISSPNSLYTDVNALDFFSPQTLGGASALDGNAAANRTLIGPVPTTVSWAPGTNLFLRWVDTNFPGPNPTAGTTRADNGVGIDDLTFTAVPEPASLCLLGLGSVALLAARRRTRESKSTLDLHKKARVLTEVTPAPPWGAR